MEITRTLLRAKLHRATVTDADLNYEGSITLPPTLMNAAQLVENEQVHVWNVTAGTRIVTYAITGVDESTICLNGAAARYCSPGDSVIIACFVAVPESCVAQWQPIVVLMNPDNSIKEIVHKEETPHTTGMVSV